VSDPQEPTDARRGDDGIEPDPAREEALEEGELDGAPTPVTPREQAELQAQLQREMRFDGFEQGMQG